jgi:hypothetical protein
VQPALLAVNHDSDGRLWSRASRQKPRTCSLYPPRVRSRTRNCGPAILAPVYGWFTEGFDTLDLKEAKALLNKLRA